MQRRDAVPAAGAGLAAASGPAGAGGAVVPRRQPPGGVHWRQQALPMDARGRVVRPHPAAWLPRQRAGLAP